MISRKFVSALLGIALFGIAQSNSQSQIIPESKKVKTGLGRVIDVRSGQVSLSELLKGLSADSGLSIVAEEYLANRTVVISLGTIPIRRVLDAICEVNGFDWKITGEGSISVFRSGSKPTDNYADIPLLMQKSMPMDLQRYLRFDRLTSSDRNERMLASSRAFGVNQAFSGPKEILIHSLCEKLKSTKSLRFDELSRSEQNTLVAYHLFRFIIDMSDVLYDDFGPHKIDIDQTSFALHKGILMVKTKMYSNQGKPEIDAGFGVGGIKRP